jgi:hypothetical protein
MRYVIYEDAEGFRWRRGIPNNAEDSEARFGTPFGPPDLAEVAAELGWPTEFHRRLHNQLADRELWTGRELKRAGGMRPLVAAVISAAKGDAAHVAAAYQNAPTD